MQPFFLPPGNRGDSRSEPQGISLLPA